MKTLLTAATIVAALFALPALAAAPRATLPGGGPSATELAAPQAAARKGKKRAPAKPGKRKPGKKAAAPK